MFCSSCGVEASATAQFCQKCGASLGPSAAAQSTGPNVQPISAAPVAATKKRKSEFAGAGCLIQLVGLVLLFFFPIGTIFGVALLLYGSAKSIKLVCSSCGNTVEKTSTMCPHCRASFELRVGPSGEPI